ncbi:MULTISPECIES: hypothetical protein [unclassified Janthinobacterium]|uniref:hypothetical protein n=1 Tax=unclassified Janthinobacterium TaxID=2610881 RepID=UPI001E4A00D0|nr:MULTISPECIES: hypothetical protein [unclassified Janthinobacterium]MCC7643610.1 hypothetical protein [Janthinobacterium sp. EB271-G4-3-1]MCC7691422.1 hypothetical protein [Janthinobacterium sp. EB271-G4-3-2]
MRFIFQNGGRTGAKNIEALGGALAGYVCAEPGARNVELVHGELVPFRDEATLMRELAQCRQEVQNRQQQQGGQFDQNDLYEALQVLAATYWAEAERMDMERSTPAGAPKGTARI